MLHSDDSSYGKLQMAAYMGKVVDEIEAGVGNTILSAILRAIKEKVKNPPEQNSTRTNRHSEWQRQCTVQLISSVEPVAYFRYNGQNWAMSATECGLMNKYMKNYFSSAWNSTNNLRG